MSTAELGRITVVVSVETIEYEDEGEVTIDASSPPKLAVEIDLPWDNDTNIERAATMLSKIVDQLQPS